MAGQSIKEYSDFKVWMRDFLYVMLEKSWKVLRKDGYMVIHMSDLFKKNICEPMCLYAMSHLPDIEFIGCFCSVGKAGKPRPLWVFKKSGNT